ncbi:hypothetical protein GQX74_005177 [Glossina fuscipes]|nr:hypothetical protein GQX74_005177 [Glossina fuscipes]
MKRKFKLVFNNNFFGFEWMKSEKTEFDFTIASPDLQMFLVAINSLALALILCLSVLLSLVLNILFYYIEPDGQNALTADLILKQGLASQVNSKAVVILYLAYFKNIYECSAKNDKSS